MLSVADSLGLAVIFAVAGLVGNHSKCCGIRDYMLIMVAPLWGVDALIKRTGVLIVGFTFKGIQPRNVHTRSFCISFWGFEPKK